MPPKSKKLQATAEDAEKDAIKVGPLVQWLVKDAATVPLVQCPVGRCYANAAMHDSRLYVFGGWNGRTRTEALKAKKIPNLQLNQNLLNMGPATSTLSASAAASAPSPVSHVPAPPSSAPAGATKKKPALDKSGLGQSQSPNTTNLAATVTAPVNGFFADGSRVGTAAGTTTNHTVQLHTIPHPCHERDVGCFDIGTTCWTMLENCSGEPHPGTSQAGVAEFGAGALLLFGGWDGYRRHNALTLFSLLEDRWKPFVTTSDVTPPPVCFHACCGYGRRFFVFGGETAEGLLADMYILDVQSIQWTVAPNTGVPTKRSSHTMTVLQGLYVVVIGGRNADGVALNDVAIFDISNNHWVLGVKTNGIGPARYGHTAVAISDKAILVYGGAGPKVGVPPAAATQTNTKEKVSEKDKEAQQAAATLAAIGSYTLHSDVWVLRMSDKVGVVSWERCQVGTSTDPVHQVPARGSSPARSIGSLGDASSAPTPVPPELPSATPPHSNLNISSRAPTPTSGGVMAPQPAVAPVGRCGHCSVLYGSSLYVFGGRTDNLGEVSKSISVLDISSLLPPPPATPTDGRDTRMDNDSAMRAPSSALTQ